MPMFNERLKELRIERGLTQEQLARNTNIPAATIRRLEVSQSIPRKERLILLSNYFDVSIDYLLGETDQRSHSKKLGKYGSLIIGETEKHAEEATEYVLRELVKKYNIDLTNPHSRETLEKMIKLVQEDL